MARNRRAVVPGAERALDQFKAKVMREQGYPINPQHPENVKYEVAHNLGIPLKPGYNGKLPAELAGKVGGQIGGKMVREMIRMAQQQLANKR